LQRIYGRYRDKTDTDLEKTRKTHLDGELVCTAGMIFTGEKQCELWAVFSKKLIAHKKTLLKSLKSVLFDFVIPANDIKRITILSRIGFSKSQTLLKHLGFHQCGIIQKNYYLYERLM